MPGAQIFQVITEFRFDVGAAVVGTEKLQGAVEKLSSAADDTLITFQRLGLGLVAQMGLGTGGVLSIFGKAIEASDKFRQSQLQLANVIAPMTVPFDERMGMAAESMENMNKLANEFALPVDDLIQFTKILGPMLSAKGLAGFQFSRAIDISRSLLKSAPTLGVDPGLIEGQLMRMIEGHADTGDTLFNRLVADTATMQKFAGNTKAFNLLPVAERVGVIQKAFKEFSSDTKILEANVRTLRGQFQLLQDAITGSMSILRPLGDALLKPIVMILRNVNAFLRKEGAEIFKSLGRMLGSLTADPEKMLATIMQFRELRKDLNLAGTILGVTGALLGLHFVLRMLGVQIPLISSALALVARMVEFFSAAVFTLGASTGIINGILALLSGIFAPLILLVGLFQILSRAFAIAQISDAKALLTLTPKIAEFMARLAGLWGVFEEGIDRVARFLAPIFQVSMWFDFMIDILSNLLLMIALVVGGFQGLAFAILEFFNQIKSFAMGQGFNQGAIGNAFGAGVDDVLEKVLGKLGSKEAGGVANNVTNVGKIDIINQFKEQMEPDRIAFTLKEQLLKATQNPVQAATRSISSPLGAR